MPIKPGSDAHRRMVAADREFAAQWHAARARGLSLSQFARELGMSCDRALINRRQRYESRGNEKLPPLRDGRRAAVDADLGEPARKFAPPAGAVPTGYTTLHRFPDDTGTEVLQWVKTKVDPEIARKAMEAAAQAFAETLPRAKPTRAPGQVDADLLNLYLVTDYHFGMLSWHEETGADWDLQIAEDTLVGWYAEAIACSPPARDCIAMNLGDFLHFDSLAAVTPTSGHQLDADTRFAKLVRTVISVKRRIVRMLLERHERVHVYEMEGNHDIVSSVWLREMMHAHYEDEPRVTVHRDPLPYAAHRHGQTLLMFHHGHLRKFKDLDRTLAAYFAQQWGQCAHRYAHTGHYHHQLAQESQLMVIEQHRTLAAPDAYAARGGYASGRDAQVITYSAEFGEVSRVRISDRRVAAAAARRKAA